jgi:hypothetical protein
MPSHPYKTSSKSTYRFKSCDHVSSSNVRHFEMVEASGLNSSSNSQDHLQCHHVHTKFHRNPPIGSKVTKVFLFTHLRSLNVPHFRMAEATRLKKWRRCQL